jgi:hypothetical protein
MSAWIAKDKTFSEDKCVEGKLGELLGPERWTKTGAACLNIDDMEGGTCLLEDIEADVEQEEGCGSFGGGRGRSDGSSNAWGSG